MTEQGVVVKIQDNFAVCRIGRNSACATCGKCGMTENQKHVDFFVENTLSAKVGDAVQIEIPDANTAKLAFFAYFVPLAPALALLFGSLAAWGKDWISLLLFFVGLVAGYGIVAVLDKRKKRKWAASPKMTKIVAPVDEAQQTDD